MTYSVFRGTLNTTQSIKRVNESYVDMEAVPNVCMVRRLEKNATTKLRSCSKDDSRRRCYKIPCSRYHRYAILKLAQCRYRRTVGACV